MLTITFYNNTAEVERANKMAFLTNAKSIDGVFRDEISITEPIILVESDKPINYNYCYINVLHRFYYIDEIVIVREGLYEISCSVDVLMSYYNILKEQVGFIDYQENRHNLNIVDPNVGVEQGFNVEEITLENDLYDTTQYELESNANYVLYGLAVGTGSNVEEQNNE